MLERLRGKSFLTTNSNMGRFSISAPVRTELDKLGATLPITAFEEAKQRGFYVDPGNDERGFYWKEPDCGRFDWDFGQDIMNVVRHVVGGARAYSRREIEIWAEHFGFDLGGDAHPQFLQWEAAMEREGFDPHR